MLGDTDGEDLLDDLMGALNALAAAGSPVTIRNGRLECPAGTVIPSAGGRWASRPLVPSFPSMHWPPWPMGDWSDGS